MDTVIRLFLLRAYMFVPIPENTDLSPGGFPCSFFSLGSNVNTSEGVSLTTLSILLPTTWSLLGFTYWLHVYLLIICLFVSIPNTLFFPWKLGRYLKKLLRGTWVTRLSMWRLISAQVMISRFVGLSPASGCADSVGPAWDSLSLSAPLLFAFFFLSLSQSKEINLKKNCFKLFYKNVYRFRLTNIFLNILLYDNNCWICIAVKPWFVSIICSWNMLVIQSTCISKQISRTIDSVVIMRCLSSCATRVARHHSFIKSEFIKNVCLSCRILTEQITLNLRFYCICIKYYVFDIVLSLLLCTISFNCKNNPICRYHC